MGAGADSALHKVMVVRKEERGKCAGIRGAIMID